MTDDRSFLDGGKDASRLIHERDWSGHPMGAPEAWPAELRAALSLILNSPESMILCWGPDLHFFFNEAYFPLLGPRVDWAMGMPFEVVWADAWLQAKPIIDEALAGRSQRFNDLPWKLDTDRGSADSWFTFSYSRILDSQGEVAGLFIFTNETTERVLADASLKESQAAASLSAQRVQLALAAGAIIGTWVWDIPGDRFTADEAFARAFGLDPVLCRDGIPLERIFVTVHPDDRAGLTSAIDQALARGGSYVHQYRVRRSDDHYYWIEANGRVDFGPDGKPSSFPGVLIDIERRRAVEAERDLALNDLRSLNETLEERVADRTAELMRTEDALRQAQKMEAVGQLTGGIAHDFNNLLAAISSSIQVVKTKLARGQADDLGRYIDVSESSIRRAAALTQRLLAFSRRQTLDPKPVNVNRMVGSMEELIRRTVGPNIDFQVVGAGGLWPTLADPSQLENSLLNLCINARDAMLPLGGRLTVETANKWFDDTTAAERELAAGQYISLCVTDTGTGMEPHVVKRVFDPFFTTKPTGQGTGLGLSMVYGFARQSGGNVRVYTEVGHGTTMCLYLPRYVGDAEEEVRPPSASSVARSEGETVALVEDEDNIRMMLAELLEEAGYRVLQGADGPAGLRLLQAEGRIDLLITDVGLPGGLNGRQVADAGRALRPGLKVLFLTGYAENAAVGNGLMEAGMQVMTKPFDIDVLIRKVGEMLMSAGPLKGSK